MPTVGVLYDYRSTAVESKPYMLCYLLISSIEITATIKFINQKEEEEEEEKKIARQNVNSFIEALSLTVLISVWSD